MTATAERAGTWFRVSSNDQNEASQFEDVGTWVTSHEYDVTRTYTVHGGSAYKNNRKFDREWASVLDDMRAGRITVLVVWKQDRLDRKLNTFGMLAEVVEAGGRVEFVTQTHLNDLTTMGGRIALKVQEEIAHAESQDKSDRIKANHAELRGRGMLVGRYPWGYASEGDKYNRVMVTTAEGEQYAEEAFTRIADGGTLPAVAAWLRDRTDQEWHPRTVAAMIRNPSYRGEHRDAAGRTICKCPALVSGEMWRRANASLDARPSSRRGQRTDLTTGAALLSGLACCANPECTAGPDSPMYRIAPPGRPAVYRCSGRGAQRKGCGCNVDQASADALMDQAMTALAAPVLRPVFHAAEGHQAELDDIAQALEDLPRQGLSRTDQRAKQDRLWAEQDRLEGLPAKPAWTEHVATGETYGQKWARSDQAERRAWLRDAGFALYLGKPEYVLADPSRPGDQSARMDVYEDSRALLVFRWTGDEDEGLLRGQSYGDPAESAA